MHNFTDIQGSHLLEKKEKTVILLSNSPLINSWLLHVTMAFEQDLVCTSYSSERTWFPDKYGQLQPLGSINNIDIAGAIALLIFSLYRT